MAISAQQSRFELSGDLARVETRDGTTFVTPRQSRRGSGSSASFVLEVCDDSVAARARAIKLKACVVAQGYVERSGDRDSIIVVDRLEETPRRQTFANRVEFGGELVQRGSTGVLSQGWTLTREPCHLLTIKQGAKCYTVKVPPGLVGAVMGVLQPKDRVSVVGHMWPYRRGGRDLVEITAVSITPTRPVHRRP